MGGGAALHKRRGAGRTYIRVIDGGGETLPEEAKELAAAG
jgi:hypothetical protein